MFICTFSMLALFSSAANGKSIKKIVPAKQIVEVTAKAGDYPPAYQVTVTCPNGYSFTSCCYNSYTEAQNAGWALYFEICE